MKLQKECYTNQDRRLARIYSMKNQQKHEKEDKAKKEKDGKK